MRGCSGLRVIHGVHTPQPVETVDVEVSELGKVLTNAEFSGVFGVGAHTYMPQNRDSRGSPDRVFRSSEELRRSVSRGAVRVATFVETNIHSSPEFTWLDVDLRRWPVDYVITSAHCTERCWLEGRSPYVFLAVYSRVIRGWNQATQLVLGHPFVYAKDDPGATAWCFAQLLKLASSHNVIVGIPIYHELRSNGSWKKVDLAHPLYGLPVLKWEEVLEIAVCLGSSLRLTLDFDLHVQSNLTCLTGSNLALLKEVLEEAKVLSNFCV